MTVESFARLQMTGRVVIVTGGGRNCANPTKPIPKLPRKAGPLHTQNFWMLMFVSSEF